MLKWDGSVNILVVIQTVAIMAGIVKLFSRLDRLETKVEPLWEWFVKHKDMR